MRMLSFYILKLGKEKNELLFAGGNSRTGTGCYFD